MSPLVFGRLLPEREEKTAIDALFRWARQGPTGGARLLDISNRKNISVTREDGSTCTYASPEKACTGLGIQLDDPPAPEQTDTISHPSHYVVGKMEVIDVIEDFGLGFHLGNVVKYVLRSGRKNDALEDLKKARWYLDRAIATHQAPKWIGKMGVIDVIENFGLGYHLGNVVECVLSSARDNNPVEYLEKARRFLERAITNAEEKP
jgi:hypothetical protein